MAFAAAELKELQRSHAEMIKLGPLLVKQPLPAATKRVLTQMLRQQRAQLLNLARRAEVEGDDDVLATLRTAMTLLDEIHACVDPTFVPMPERGPKLRPLSGYRLTRRGPKAR